MREIIKGEELLRRIVWDDQEGYEVVETKHDGMSRWAAEMQTVFKRLSDGQLFLCHWRKGATEYQDNEYPDEAYACEAFSVTTTDYRLLK